ncbi:unnamed protein product [Bursaphelenchus xylophilus]|nr:unnamed protein product [Bursaphelenchus xylophilus]CAG9125340.1 unnamed protein product [Bursaphelenchus xylophilus]
MRMPQQRRYSVATPVDIYGHGQRQQVNSKFRKRTSTFPEPKAKFSPAKCLNQEKRRLDTNNNRTADEMLGEDKKTGAKKRKLLTKLFRVLTLKDISVGKTYPRDYRAKHASAKRKRARHSQSSTLSNYEPMPTILEESDSELASVQSTVHRFSGLHVSPSNNTLTAA